MKIGETLYPLLEEVVLTYIKDQWEQQITVTEKKIGRMAKSIFPDM